MKLSEAIRAGAKLRPQCRFAYFTQNGYVSSCSFGAAAEGSGLDPYLALGSEREEVERHLALKFPWLYGKNGWRTREKIFAWNDTYGLSREEIADRLEKEGL